MLSTSGGESFGSPTILWNFPSTTGFPSPPKLSYQDLYTFPALTHVDYYCGVGLFGNTDALCKPPNLLSAWVDLTGDGLPDASDVTSTTYICNGATGTNGKNGLNSLVSIVSEPSGTNCSYSGLKITSGLDTNGNGALDPGEVASTSYSCSSDSAPIIESIYIYPQPVLTSANLLVNAFNQNGDSLIYSWTIGGTSMATGASSIWNSPGIPGYYLAGLAVSDGTYTIKRMSGISVASASPWPKRHRDIQSTGISPIDTSATAGTLKWSYTTGGLVFSSPAIGADGIVYVGSDDSKLYAIK